jgi:hypothetical protein
LVVARVLGRLLLFLLLLGSIKLFKGVVVIAGVGVVAIPNPLVVVVVVVLVELVVVVIELEVIMAAIAVVVASARGKVPAPTGVCVYAGLDGESGSDRVGESKLDSNPEP